MNRGRSVVLGLDPIYASRDQTARIQQMLRAEAPLRPAAAIVELDTQKIADFPKNTVFYCSTQFAIGIRDVQGGTQRHWAVYLQTRARKGNVFEIRNAAAAAPIRVFPLDIDQVRAQHPGFNSAIQHILLLLSDSRRRSISSSA